MLTAEQGKTLPDAEGDVFRGLEVVEHAASIGNLQMGELANNVANGVDTYTCMQPLGVCAGITPFNFPAMIPLWMFPMAIATGNTFVLKPSEQDPLVTMRLVELALEAGVPKGVLNVVHGGVDAVNLHLRPPGHQGGVVRRFHQGRHPRLQPRHADRQARAVHDGREEPCHGPAGCQQGADARTTCCGAAFGAAGQRCMAPAGGGAGGRSADLAAGPDRADQDPQDQWPAPSLAPTSGPVISLRAPWIASTA